ncbi:DUF438 domain-containing protein [Carboxydothermus ferrireducens]|uniref:PAC domain-containing protein n=1 Tax=Carboxydothermus ferrireducens DSM 11255 TaxID=1119529 RepID=A0ABX2R5D2_9THEO|nr:DUF438 domain-containing protein [Carboxydothermus ferrireducens]NYE56376.1 hypothetical protein [Carboxydothermus ferrireducens DSM 11255]
MSELINNREFRKKAIKEIILDLHRGKTVEEVKERFDEIIKDVAPTEITLIEQMLIQEGLPVEEVQRLCDVHAAVFKESLEEQPAPETQPGHPVYTFKEENRAVEKLIEEIREILAKFKATTAGEEKNISLELTAKLNLLYDLDKHYSRKENLLFPFLEKHNIMGPPKVMWGVDDEIRAALKEARLLALHYDPDKKAELLKKTEAVLAKIEEMIFKEEKILFPMCLETLSEDEWWAIYEQSDEIGYCLIEPQTGWKPKREISVKNQEITKEGYIKFSTGLLTQKEIGLIFNHLPVDITFVDKDGIVKYFSESKERVFVRPKTIIGRRVENCHPPASVHIVEKLVDDLKSGRKDFEDFWIHYQGKYVLIRYIAVRDEKGEFMGVLEVTQDIKPLQAISGEKRIME